jgi:hypothetical protein
MRGLLKSSSRQSKGYAVSRINIPWWLLSRTWQRLGGRLFAVMTIKGGSEFVQSISDILQAGYELRTTNGTDTSRRSARDLVVDPERSFCHNESFPQVGRLGYPCGITVVGYFEF